MTALSKFIKQETNLKKGAEIMENDMKNMSEEAKMLKVGMEMYFVDAKHKDPMTGFFRWVRNPLQTKEEAMNLMSIMMDDFEDYKEVRLQPEDKLNDWHMIWDEEKKDWVEDSQTMRSYLFGESYQRIYEMYCIEAGVNLDLIAEWQMKRESALN